MERVASQKLTKPLPTIRESVTVAVRVTMAPAETGPLGETTSTVVVGEMTTAFKFIVAVAKIKKPIKSFTAGGKTYLRIESDRINRSNKREAIVLFFVAWRDVARFPMIFIL
jgi:hypothetical protein